MTMSEHHTNNKQQALASQSETAALKEIFAAAIDCAAPEPAVLRNLPEKPRGRCIVIGAGKASAAMAAAVDKAWPDVDVSGVVTTRYEHGVDAGRIHIIEAGHPVPDHASVEGAKAILAALENVTEDDLVLALISGGGSATLSLPLEGVTLADKQALTKALLTSGATIEEMNVVRKHLSQVKGGRLGAAAAPAQLVTLMISDVPGDDPASVASGPTIFDNSTAEQAVAVLDNYSLAVPEAVKQALTANKQAPIPPQQHRHVMIATPAQALLAAEKKAQVLGFNTLILGDCLEGESKELGKIMAGIAQSVQTMAAPAKAPLILLSGGETTVTMDIAKMGRGGRNTEFALALATTLRGKANIWALAADSDGIDGTEDAAGAVITPDTLERATKVGFDANKTLQQHDSYALFAAINDLIITGPTLTNVNDIRIVLIK